MMVVSTVDGGVQLDAPLNVFVVRFSLLDDINMFQDT